MTANHPVSQTTLDQARGQALKTGETINVPDLASEITECLADLIVCSASLEEQPRLVAHIVEQPGRFVTEKREAGVGAQLFADLPEVGNEQVCTVPAMCGARTARALEAGKRASYMGYVWTCSALDRLLGN